MNSKRFIILFLAKAFILYIVWFFVYDLWLTESGWLDAYIIDNLVNFGGHILINVFDYKLFIYEHTIGIDGSHGVYIGTPCNGLELMALFAGFVIIFPGEIKNKIWYIPIGIVTIHFLNLLRVIALTLMVYYSPESIDFNHKYTFTIILYSFVFLGWILWVKYFSSRTPEM